MVKNKIQRMVFSAMFLAIALVLPLLTAQIPELGNALCPMHLPIFLCAFICGPLYGTGIGFIAPLLRFLIFGMPPIVPKGISMAVELAVYGLVTGLVYMKLSDKKINIYISLIIGMIAGRLAWALARIVLYGLGKSEFGWLFFITESVLNAIPGIVLQLILVPIIVMLVRKLYRNGEVKE